MTADNMEWRGGGIGARRWEASPGKCHQLASMSHPHCLQQTTFQFLWQLKSILFSDGPVWWQLSTKPRLASTEPPWLPPNALSLKAPEIVWWMSPHPWSLIDCYHHSTRMPTIYWALTVYSAQDLLSCFLSTSAMRDRGNGSLIQKWGKQKLAKA